MKRKIVLAASLAAGFLAAVCTRLYVASKESELSRRSAELMARYRSIRALAFKKDVHAGTVLSLAELGVTTVPMAGLRGQAVEETSLRDVLDRKLLVPRAEGEVLFWSDVEGGNPSARGLSADVSRQMRAMSINVSGAAAVSGMVMPNDHVDVIGTFDFPDPDTGRQRKGDFVTCTILQNVLVLATGRETSKSQSRQVGLLNSAYSTVTLEVTPREAEMLAFAEQMKGRLVLTLRNRNDTSTEKELPSVDFARIRGEIERLNQKRQSEKAGGIR